MATIKKTLYKIPIEGQISGVCAGLARYFDLDVTLVRVIYVILAFLSAGTFILLYIILAIILPADRNSVDETVGEKINRFGKDMSEGKAVKNIRNYLGVFLILIGISLLAKQLFPNLFEIDFDLIWPIIIVFIGIFIIFKKRG